MSIPGLSIDGGSDRPVYRQIAEAILRAAREGRLESGARLPPTRDLARQLRVNRNTVTAAYDSLASEGWIHSRTGRGTFLNVPDPASLPSAEGEFVTDASRAAGGAPHWIRFSKAVDGVAHDGLQSIYSMVVDGKGIAFVGSYPDSSLLPVKAFSAAMQRALSENGAAALGYGPTAGLHELRDLIAGDMRKKGMRADADQVLITNGAQQALDLIFRSFLDPGDTVLIEEPTYTGTLSVAKATGARVVGVPVDSQGAQIDPLEAALQRERPKLIYLQPTFQNPTTAVMSLERRHQVVALARKYRVLVIEDDWGGDLRFEGEPLPTLHQIDGGEHVLYLSTFSKKLMPGLRIGWVAAPHDIARRLAELKRTQDCGTSPLLQCALYHFLNDHGLEPHLQTVRAAYKSRRDAMLAAIRRHIPEGQVDTPAGGMFVWLRLPDLVDGEELFAASRRSGIRYSRGKLFHAGGGGQTTLRLTYSAATPDEIEEGIGILGKLVREQIERASTAKKTEDSLGTYPLM